MLPTLCRSRAAAARWSMKASSPRECSACPPIPAAAPAVAAACCRPPADPPGRLSPSAAEAPAAPAATYQLTSQKPWQQTAGIAQTKEGYAGLTCREELFRGTEGAYGAVSGAGALDVRGVQERAEAGGVGGPRLHQCHADDARHQQHHHREPQDRLQDN